MKTIIYHTFSTGFWRDGLPNDSPAQPHLIGLGAVVIDEEGWTPIERMQVVAQLPTGASVDPGAASYHGINNDAVRENGVALKHVLNEFAAIATGCELAAVYGEEFHSGIILASLRRTSMRMPVIAHVDLMKKSTGICRIPSRNGEGFKFPKLGEAYEHFNGRNLMIDAESGPTRIIEQVTNAVVEIHKGYRRYQDRQALNAARPLDLPPNGETMP